MKKRIIEILLSENDGVEDLAHRIDQLYNVPTKEDIENEAWVYEGYVNRKGKIDGFSFMQGGLWVLSEIKNK